MTRMARRLQVVLLGAAGLFLALAASAGAGEAQARPQPAPLVKEAPGKPAESINLYDDGEKAGPPPPRASIKKDTPLSMVARVGFWLGLVLALVCGLVVLAKKVMPRSGAWGQTPAAELLGRTCLDSKRSIYLLKVGGRVLVVGSAENGLSSLGEVADRAEVDYLACLARGRAARAGGGRSDFARFLGERLSRLVGGGGEQVVEDVAVEEEPEAPAAPADPSGARADGVQALEEQLARLKRIS